MMKDNKRKSISRENYNEMVEWVKEMYADECAAYYANRLDDGYACVYHFGKACILEEWLYALGKWTPEYNRTGALVVDRVISHDAYYVEGDNDE